MRYLVFFEVGPDDYDKALKRRDESTVVRETTPSKFPKVLLEAHEILGDLPKLTESFREFIVLETDDPKQLEDLVAFWKSEAQEMKTVKLCVVPITDFYTLTSSMGRQKEQRRTSR